MARRHYRRARRNPMFGFGYRRRRNPEVLGVEVADAGAALVGAWGTKNLAAFASGPLAMVKGPIDNIRPGLGLAAFEMVAAPIVGRIVRMVKPSWSKFATLGGGIVAVNDGINAVLGSVNLVAGMPLVTSFGMPAPKALPAGSAERVDRTAALGVGSTGL